MRARTEEAKDERRAAFLRAALNEFFEKGFAAARVDDIARRAGFSKGTLYLYFKNKEALFQGLIESVAVPKVEQMEMMVNSAPSASAALGGILRIVPQVIRGSMLPRLIKILVGDGGQFPGVALSYRTAVIDRGLATIASLLERGHATGELVVEDADLTARLVIAPMIFSVIWHILFEKKPADKIDLDALLSLHHRMLMRALSPIGETS